MPIYEYECPKCHNVFEEWVTLSCAHGEEPCPKCGTSSPRVISHTSFVLKGGGWYVTEYGYRKNVHEDQGGTVTKDTPKETSASKEDSNTKPKSSEKTTKTPTTPKPAPAEQSSPKKQESKPAPQSN